MKTQQAAERGEMVVAHLAPAGRFEIVLPAALGGRTAFNLTPAAAGEIVAVDARWATPTVIDYGFQTALSAINGQPAPAAGWISALQWSPSRGLFAVAALLPGAVRRLVTGAPHWIAPMFQAQPNGAWKLAFASLVDTPAIDGTNPVRLGALADDTEALSMHPEHLAILRACSVSVADFASTRRTL
jgi:phage I-like protein